MHIRVKFENKARRIAKPFKTLSELRGIIAEQFSQEASKLNILYKDCDEELVNIIDDQDLVNCIEEATELKSKTLTFLLKAKLSGSRSSSSKSSLSEEEFVKLPLLAEAKPEEQPIIEQKKELIIEQKKELIIEHKKKIEELEQKKEQRLENLEKNQQKEKSKSRPHRGCGKHREHSEKNGEKKEGHGLGLMKGLRFIGDYAEKNGIANPMKNVKAIFEELKTECPGLGLNPKLINKMLEKGREGFKTLIKESYSQAVKECPELEKETIDIKAKFEEMKNKLKEKIQGFKDKHKAGHHHREHKRAHREVSDATESSSDSKEVPIEVEEKKPKISPEEKQAKQLERERKLKEKEMAKQERERVRKEKEEERLRQFQAREALKRKREEEKEAQKDQIKLRMKEIVPIFPKMDKKELRAIVAHNMSTSNEELIQLVMSANKNKSSSTNKKAF